MAPRGGHGTPSMRGWCVALVGMLWVFLVVRIAAPERAARHHHVSHGSASHSLRDSAVDGDHLQLKIGSHSLNHSHTKFATSRYVCSHRGVFDDGHHPLSKSMHELCDLSVVHAGSGPARTSMQVCCADYDVFFSSDGVPFVGHPDVVAQLLNLTGGANDLLTHAGDGAATSAAAIEARDPDGRVTMKLAAAVAFIDEIHERLLAAGCAPANGSRSRRECDRHRNVFFSFEPKLPLAPHRDDGIFLQRLGTLAEAIAKELSGVEGLCGLVIDPSEPDAASLRDHLSPELRFIAPLKDRWLVRGAASGSVDDLSSEADNSPESNATTVVSASGAPKAGKNSAKLCEMLVAPPSWAAMVAPSILFLERCVEWHRDHLEHAIANHHRHGRSEVALPLMEVWLVDDVDDLRRLDAVSHDLPELRATYIVSNFPRKMMEVIKKQA